VTGREAAAISVFAVVGLRRAYRKRLAPARLAGFVEGTRLRKESEVGSLAPVLRIVRDTDSA
jgi:hypothetical protein